MFTRAPSGSSFNVEMRVGALEETISVTGEGLVVDFQRIAPQAVLSKEVVEAIPTSQYFVRLGV